MPRARVARTDRDAAPSPSQRSARVNPDTITLREGSKSPAEPASVRGLVHERPVLRNQGSEGRDPPLKGLTGNAAAERHPQPVQPSPFAAGGAPNRGSFFDMSAICCPRRFASTFAASSVRLTSRER